MVFHGGNVIGQVVPVIGQVVPVIGQVVPVIFFLRL